MLDPPIGLKTASRTRSGPFFNFRIFEGWAMET